MTAAIEISGLGKRYWQLEEQAMLLKSVLPMFRAKKTERWALRDIDLDVQQGESLGIVGRNGAGKTTLLRLLAGVSRPTAGQVVLRGRVAPLIGVGVGFHQEMSGRENIYVNALLLGMTKREVAERIDRIIDFAEIADYIDTPVKFYSTGMFLRLGFSVAAHVDPDILLIDEILAVGDLAFQVKCIERMRELQRQGTTVVMVSHSMHAIRALCTRGVLIRKGRIEVNGSPEDAIARHHELMTVDTEEGSSSASATIVERQVIGEDGPTHNPRSGDRVSFRATIEFHREVDTPQIYFQVISESGVLAYDITSDVARTGQPVRAGQRVTVEIPFRVRLAGGTYNLRMTVMSRDLRETLVQDLDGYVLYVAHRPGTGGVADLDASISVGGREATDFGWIDQAGDTSAPASNGEAQPVPDRPPLPSWALEEPAHSLTGDVEAPAPAPPEGASDVRE